MLERLARSERAHPRSRCGTGRLTAELFAVMREGLVSRRRPSATMLQQAAAQNTWHVGPHPPIRRRCRRASTSCVPTVCTCCSATPRRRAQHRDVPLDSITICSLRASTARSCPAAGSSPNAAAPATSRRCWRAPMRCAPGDPFAPHFGRLARSVELCDRAGDDRTPRSRRLHRDRRLARSGATTLPDRDTYREFLWTVCAREHVARLPKELRPPFLDALAEQAAAHSPPFTLDYRRLNIYARKPPASSRRPDGGDRRPAVPYAENAHGARRRPRRGGTTLGARLAPGWSRSSAARPGWCGRSRASSRRCRSPSASRYSSSSARSSSGTRESKSA